MRVCRVCVCRYFNTVYFCPFKSEVLLCQVPGSIATHTHTRSSLKVSAQGYSKARRVLKCVCWTQICDALIGFSFWLAWARLGFRLGSTDLVSMAKCVSKGPVLQFLHLQVCRQDTGFQKTSGRRRSCIKGLCGSNWSRKNSDQLRPVLVL